MDRSYQPLPILELGRGAGLRRPVQHVPVRVQRDSPALDVMTDLAKVTPATIRSQAPVDAANQFMIARGVRLLLVVDERDVVLGVVTVTDILGERCMRVATQRALPHADLKAGDVMTPAEQVEVIALAEVEGARVGHIVETLRLAGRQHALVVDEDVIAPQRLIDQPVRRRMVRGIFSISQIARQLGVTFQTTEVARTFADIEAALAA